MTLEYHGYFGNNKVYNASLLPGVPAPALLISSVLVLTYDFGNTESLPYNYPKNVDAVFQNLINNSTLFKSSFPL